MLAPDQSDKVDGIQETRLQGPMALPWDDEAAFGRRIDFIRNYKIPVPLFEYLKADVRMAEMIRDWVVQVHGNLEVEHYEGSR